MIHYTGSISRSVGSYWFSCIFAGTIVASSLPRLIVPGFASSGWRNRIWTLMRFPLGTSTNRQSRIRHSIIGTATEFLSRNKIAPWNIYTTHVCASTRIFPTQHIDWHRRLYRSLFQHNTYQFAVIVHDTNIWLYISYFGRIISLFTNFYNIIYPEISLCLSKRIMCLQLQDCLILFPMIYLQI